VRRRPSARFEVAAQGVADHVGVGAAVVLGSVANGAAEFDLAEDRLSAFATLSVYTVSDLVQAGFEIVPTFRSPHATIAFYDDPDIAVPRLLGTPHRTFDNPASREEDQA
jgi:hypothetical protein